MAGQSCTLNPTGDTTVRYGDNTAGLHALLHKNNMKTPTNFKHKQNTNHTNTETRHHDHKNNKQKHVLKTLNTK